MDPLRQYEIAFVGLKQGVTNFNYHIDSSFFDLFPESLVHDASMDVALKFDKHQSFFELSFHFEGKAHLPCDRCGAGLNYPILSEYSIVVKFDEHRDGDNDDSLADVVYISPNETHFNVAQLIYEFANLSIPVHHITCDNLKGQKPCNQEVLDQLKYQQQNEPFVDPRWDKLSKIKFK